MKMRMVGVIAFLLAGNVVANDVYLRCEGSYERCNGGDPQNVHDTTCWEASWNHGFRINEEAEAISGTEDFTDWQEAKSVEFTATEIKAEFKRSGNIFKRREEALANPINFFSSKRDLSINRMTGRIDGDERQGQCQVVEVDRQLF